MSRLDALARIVDWRAAPAGPVAKVCTCCGAEYTRAQFVALPRPRAGEFLALDDQYVAQLRTCPCLSTIALERHRDSLAPGELS